MKKICCWIDESTWLKLLQRIKNLGAQLLVTYPRGFHQKYHSRELFHKRSKDSMYHRMLRKKSNSGSKIPWKRSVVGESRQQDWSSWSKMSFKRCAVEKSKQRNWTVAMANSRTTSLQKIQTEHVSQNAQEKANYRSEMPWKRYVVGESRQHNWSFGNKSRI